MIKAQAKPSRQSGGRSFVGLSEWRPDRLAASSWSENGGRLTEELVKKGIVMVSLVAGLMAGPALAQDRMDCGKASKDLWQRIERETYAKMSPDQLAAASRLALHAYDSC